jgi:hypothetical protein
MPTAAGLADLYWHLAHASESAGDREARDRFLTLVSRSALEAGWPDLADECHRRVIAGRSDHALARFSSANEAFQSGPVKAHVKQLLRLYPFEKAEYLLEKMKAAGYRPDRHPLGPKLGRVAGAAAGVAGAAEAARTAPDQGGRRAGGTDRGLGVGSDKSAPYRGASSAKPAGPRRERDGSPALPGPRERPARPAPAPVELSNLLSDEHVPFEPVAERPLAMVTVRAAMTTALVALAAGLFLGALVAGQLLQSR